MEEEKKLNSLVEPIKNSELSPLEKYISVYNIVKDFKDENYLNDDYVYNMGRKISNIMFNQYIALGDI